jgi:hypothetical protein
VEGFGGDGEAIGEVVGGVGVNGELELAEVDRAGGMTVDGGVAIELFAEADGEGGGGWGGCESEFEIGVGV